MPLDIRMVLRSLAKHPHGLTAHAIKKLWEPIWTLDQVNLFLGELMRLGMVRASGPREVREVIYLASEQLLQETVLL